MSASRASVFDFRGTTPLFFRSQSTADRRLRSPPAAVSSHCHGKRPIVFGWYPTLSAVPCCCSVIKSSRSRASSCGSGLSKDVRRRGSARWRGVPSCRHRVRNRRLIPDPYRCSFAPPYGRSHDTVAGAHVIKSDVIDSEVLSEIFDPPPLVLASPGKLALRLAGAVMDGNRY